MNASDVMLERAQAWLRRWRNRTNSNPSLQIAYVAGFNAGRRYKPPFNQQREINKWSSIHEQPSQGEGENHAES